MTEQKEKIEETENGSILGLMFLTSAALLILAGLITLSGKKNHLKIENIRKAYSGIDTEEYK